MPGKTNPADILNKHWGYTDVWSTLQPFLFWEGNTASINGNCTIEEEVTKLKDEEQLIERLTITTRYFYYRLATTTLDRHLRYYILCHIVDWRHILALVCMVIHQRKIAERHPNDTIRCETPMLYYDN
jgi:hypothetical protein